MSTENLNNTEAIGKLQSMVNAIDIGMLSTFSKGSDYPHTVPMSRQEIEDDGSIWYLLSAESDTFKNIEANNKVSIAFAHVGNYHFLSLNGTGKISTDKERIEKYWNSFTEVWFEKGKEDPNIRLLKVTPAEAFYWDNKTNKLMTLLKVATSAITGADLDIGREGKLEL